MSNKRLFEINIYSEMLRQMYPSSFVYSKVKIKLKGDAGV